MGKRKVTLGLTVSRGSGSSRMETDHTKPNKHPESHHTAARYASCFFAVSRLHTHRLPYRMQEKNIVQHCFAMMVPFPMLLQAISSSMKNNCLSYVPGPTRRAQRQQKQCSRKEKLSRYCELVNGRRLRQSERASCITVTSIEAAKAPPMTGVAAAASRVASLRNTTGAKDQAWLTASSVTRRKRFPKKSNGTVNRPYDNKQNQ